MNRSTGYILISLSCALACSDAIAQDNDTQSASPQKRSLAIGVGTLPVAPKVVLPKTSQSIRLKRNVGKKARASYPSSHYQKAMYFKQKGDKSRALVEFLKATQENPHLVKAFYEQALIFRDRGYLKLAQSSLEQALAMKPDFSEGRMLLATVQIQQGNVGGAMQQLGQSLGLNVAPKATKQKGDDEFPPPTVLQSLHALLPENIAEGVARLTVGKSSAGSDTAGLDLGNLPALPPDESKSDAGETKKKPAKKQKREKKNWFSRFMTALDTPPEGQNVAPPAPPPITADDDVKPAAEAVKRIAALKPEQATEVPAQIETFEKPDQPKLIIEKVAALASSAISGVSKTPFQIPNLPTVNSSLFNTHSGGSAMNNDPRAPQIFEEPKPYKPVIAPNSDDPWSVRLRYLADHGTGTLKEGEAFMFSEESGEATLFLSDGQTVRRTIYLPRDAQEVVKQRRPDILSPEDLLYNLSLLAKLMPKQNEQEQPANTTQTEQQPKVQPAFEVNDLMGKSQRFWGWVKDSLKL